ncbi:MAG: preprotein translocase subunit SecA [bacterium]|nr:preprotein translocase subunit SecA [bacterium]
MFIFSGIFGSENDRFVKRAFKVVAEINALEPEYKKISNEELKNKTQEFKNLLANGQTLDSILPDAFAACREASVRTLGQRHFDVQLIGSMALHEGKIAEMRTGEGKTLMATLAMYLNALEGKGVHLVTVNDYLARRDAVWMGQIYDMLGMTVGCVNHDSSYLYDSSATESKISNDQFLISKQNSNPNDKNSKPDEVRDVVGGFKVVYEFLRQCPKKEAYGADITYGTNNEYGFDYLRDNLVHEVKDLSQRSREEGGPSFAKATEGAWNFAIVDEVDSILIDEARTPLIISQPDEESGALYQKFARIVPKLNVEQDYTLDEKRRSAVLTQDGITKVEELLGVKNLYEEGTSNVPGGGIRLVHHLEQALRAQVLFKRDKDYIVKEGEVIIVDEFTGRLMPGRRYSEGLHQAIEAKEGVAVKRESRTVATITFQNYFRLYKKLAGMSGTAATSQEEFHKVYGLDVAIIPTHRPMVRKDEADLIYRSEKGKFQAVLRKVKELHEKGQPVLLGTGSIEKNEHLSVLLNQIGIPHKVLNAKNHEAEAQIIAQAGKIGAVTLATNIAGRGVDIILGGNPPAEEEAEKVKNNGGLFVLGTERHEARRIDNQLRGRAGRQGDQGESQFFVSLEDDLMRVFGGERIKNMMTRFNIPEDEAIQSSLVSRAIESAQTKIEGYHFDARQHVLEYDEVMNKHRDVVYKTRREFVEPEFKNKSKEKVLEILDGEIELAVSANTSVESNTVDVSDVLENLARIMPIDSVKQEIEKTEGDIAKITEILKTFVQSFYEKREKEIGEDQMRAIEKLVFLRTLDELWMDHLDEMEHLRDSVGLRAYGQRDPLVEYKTEGHRMFKDFVSNMENQVAGLIFKVGVVQQQVPAIKNIQYNKTEDSSANSKQIVSGEKIGRNDLCPCGSNKKYKKCHGQ